MSGDTHTGLIRLARVVDQDLMYRLDELNPDEDLFQRNGAQLNPVVLREKGSIPLLCNHDDDRRIGTVNELTYVDDIDGLWLAALVTVDDRPCWIEKGTSASMRVGFLSHRTLGPTTTVRRAWISEVSVLAPGRKPHNKGARVCSLRRSAAAGVFSDRPVAADTTTRRRPRHQQEMDELYRRCDTIGWEHFETRSPQPQRRTRLHQQPPHRAA